MATRKLISESDHFLKFADVWATVSIGVLAAFLGFRHISSDPKCKGIFTVLALLLAISFLCAMSCILMSARFYQIGTENIPAKERHAFCLSMVTGCCAFIVAIVFMFLLFICSPSGDEKTYKTTDMDSKAEIHALAVDQSYKDNGKAPPSSTRTDTLFKTLGRVCLVIAVGLFFGIVAKWVAKWASPGQREKSEDTGQQKEAEIID